MSDVWDPHTTGSSLYLNIMALVFCSGKSAEAGKVQTVEVDARSITSGLANGKPVNTITFVKSKRELMPYVVFNVVSPNTFQARSADKYGCSIRIFIYYFTSLFQGLYCFIWKFANAARFALGVILESSTPKLLATLVKLDNISYTPHLTGSCCGGDLLILAVNCGKSYFRP